MNDDQRNKVALFRLAVLGDLVHKELRRGELSFELEKKSREVWRDLTGKPHRMAGKTIQAWLYAYKKSGFDGLLPKGRSDRGQSRAIPGELQSLILDMKREDPGRSAPLILHELRGANLMRKGQFSVSAVNRLLKSSGLSGPKMEQITEQRFRFAAEYACDLWQGDACHGPKIFDPASGRKTRVKIFGLIDDKSRLVPYLFAGFHERQEDFLRVLLEAVLRRGIPRVILLDNHGSFTGTDVRVACAKLGIRLTYARPYDGAAKGKIERFWRTLRAHVLDRLDEDEVQTLDDLNLRLTSWVWSEYNQRPHGGISGRTPISVFEEDSEEIRFVEDPDSIESSFEASIERWTRNDATLSFRSTTYEVPAHLRKKKVMLHYPLLRPELVYIDDGGTRVLLQKVDPIANASRSRNRNAPNPKTELSDEVAKTGLNAIEGMLKRTLHPDGGDEQEGTKCARS